MGEVGAGILGPAIVTVDGTVVELGAARHRALLSVLALRRGQRVTTEAIIAALWGEAPPAGVASTLQGYVADLRRLLEPHRAPREAARVLVTEPGGYSLRLAEPAVDTCRFEAAVRRAAAALDALGPLPRTVADPLRRDEVAAALALVEAALAEWRGDPLSDLGADLEVELERDRLRGLRLDASVLRATGLVALGRHTPAALDLEPLARANPWHERVWGLWAIALAGSGRQAEALARLRELRSSLADELGIDPGAELREVETAIIRQELSPTAPPPGPARPRLCVVPTPAHRHPVAAEEWPLVGRDEELGTLEHVLDLAATRGLPQLVHLTGEHGLGKSRVVREVEQLATGRGFAVVHAACARGGRHSSRWAWHRLAAGLDVVAAQGPDGPPVPPSTDGAPLQDAERVLALITAVAQRRPLLLVLEDLQWADRASLRALSHVVATLPPGPVTVLLTQRLDPVVRCEAMAGLLGTLGRAHVVHLPLAPLGADDVADLLDAVTGVRAHPRLAQAVTRRTDGNPFVVVELARHDRLDGDRLPATVQAVVAHCLQSLPDDTLSLLRGASLLERTFSADLLAHAAGRPLGSVHAALAPATASGVLVEEDEDHYTFGHGVVREALADSLTPAPRARWRRGLGLALETAG